MRSTFTWALRQVAQRASGDLAQTTRAWSLLLLLSRLLLHRPEEKGGVGARDLHERVRRFWDGEWDVLLHQARARFAPPQQQGAQADPAAAEARRLALAEQKIQLGEVSHGRQVLEAAAVAPGTADTLNQLRDPRQRRPPASTRSPTAFGQRVATCLPSTAAFSSAP